MADEIQVLRDEIQERIDMARESIADAALEQDWDRAKTLATAVSDLDSSLKRLIEVRRQVRDALSRFDQLTRTTTRGARTRPQITIHWRLAGHDLNDETIDESLGADSLARYIERLVAVLGPEILTSIQQIPMGSSGLVSKTPNRDFVNPASGELYGFKKIAGTEWSVKTHSSTAHKIEQIHEIKTLLGLPRFAVETEVVQSSPA